MTAVIDASESTTVFRLVAYSLHLPHGTIVGYAVVLIRVRRFLSAVFDSHLGHLVSKTRTNKPGLQSSDFATSLAYLKLISVTFLWNKNFK